MPPPPPQPASRTAVARLLYTALCGSALGVLAIAWFLRGALLLPEGASGAVTFAAYALAASGLLAGLAFRRLIPDRTTSQSADEWWSRHLPKAVAAWAVGEGTVLISALILAVGGQVAAVLAVALAGIAVLIANAPGRLAP